MRAFLAAAFAAFFIVSTPAFAEDKCASQGTVIEALQGMGAQLIMVIDTKEEIQNFLAQLPPAPPEFKLDESSAVQIWVKREVARIVFFDDKGCASVSLDTDAETILHLIPGA